MTPAPRRSSAASPVARSSGACASITAPTSCISRGIVSRCTKAYWHLSPRLTTNPIRRPGVDTIEVVAARQCYSGWPQDSDHHVRPEILSPLFSLRPDSPPSSLRDHAHTFPECHATFDLARRVLRLGVVPNGILGAFIADFERVVVGRAFPRTHAGVGAGFQQRRIDRR